MLAQREDFDVLCLQETKLQEKDVEDVKRSLIDGYENSLWTCSISKLGYSGTAIISWTYRVTEWDPSLSNYMKELEKSKPVILTGDLNCAHQEIDIYNPAGNTQFCSLVISKHPILTELQPVHKQSGWRPLESSSMQEEAAVSTPRSALFA